MSEIWVVNASPLIARAKIGRLDVLADAGREIVVPSAVAREVLAGPADDAAAAAVRGHLAGLVVEQLDLASVIEWGLGAGETAVLSIAIGRSAKAVVDDREARSAASALKVPTLGTLGAVILAHRRDVRGDRGARGARRAGSCRMRPDAGVPVREAGRRLPDARLLIRAHARTSARLARPRDSTVLGGSRGSHPERVGAHLCHSRRSASYYFSRRGGRRT